MRFALTTFFILLFLGTTQAQNLVAATDVPSDSPSALEVLSTQDHPLFLQLVKDTGLSQHFEMPNVTFLVPSEEYFAELDPAEYDTMVKNPATVKRALEAHTISGIYSSKTLKESPSLQTVSGQAVESEFDDEIGLVVNGLTLILTDIPAANSMIHIVDDFFIETENLDEGPESLDNEDDDLE